MTRLAPRLTRRHFLTISAASLATPALSAPVARWQGRALGAAASMQIFGLEPHASAPLFAAVEAEITRLERIFSLYRVDSEVIKLNTAGVLKAPSPELLDVLSLSAQLNQRSDGLFDPTVQPLWQARAMGETTDAPVGLQYLRFDTAEVRFERPGMALTLNGIAQGAVTDRIAALLRSHGLTDVLVDIGEIAAIGQGGFGAGWKAGVATPDGTLVQRLQLRDRALATSAPMGTGIGPKGDQPHILHPMGGTLRHSLVSVSAPKAMLADGLSTAACLLPGAAARTLVDSFPGAALEVLLS